MKKQIWIILAVVVIGAGYFVYSNNQAKIEQEAAAAAEKAAAEMAEAEAAAKEAAEAAAMAAEEAAEKATAEAEAAESTVKEAVAEATESAANTAEEMGAAVDEAVDQMTDTMTQEVTEANEAAQETADMAAQDGDTTTQDGNMAQDAAAAEVTAETPAGMDEMLTPEGFDYEKVSEALENSDINANTKSMLKAALDAAKDNPDALQSVLGRIREAMGL